MIPGEFDYQLNLQRRLATCPNVRSVVDTVSDLDLFIYPFLAGDLLHLSQVILSREMKIYTLRCALHGLADMHERDVLHNGKLERRQCLFQSITDVKQILKPKTSFWTMIRAFRVK